MEISFAPKAAAVSTAVARLTTDGLSPSTSTMWHSGHAAETMSTSSAISVGQPNNCGGSGLAAPRWLTFRKQPLSVVHGGRPNVDRYTARSASTVGLSPASTIPTVCVAPSVPGRAYADLRSAGP